MLPGQALLSPHLITPQQPHTRRKQEHEPVRASILIASSSGGIPTSPAPPAPRSRTSFRGDVLSRSDATTREHGNHDRLDSGFLFGSSSLRNSKEETSSHSITKVPATPSTSRQRHRLLVLATPTSTRAMPHIALPLSSKPHNGVTK